MILLLAAALIHNGIAVASAAHPHAAAPGHQAMMQHDHGATAGHDSAGKAGNHGKPGCCGSSICHCGCTANLVALQPATLAAQVPARTQAAQTGHAGEFLPGTAGAPFRPPA